MMRRPLVLLVSLGFLVTGLGAGGGVAYAYFTSSGTGSGSASVATLKNVTVVSATATVTNKLLPGGTGDVTFNVNNQNSFDVTLVKVVGNGAVTVSGGSGCTTTGVTFSDQNSLNTTIPANGSTPVTLPNAASMSTASSAGCQGATFSVPVTITVQK